MLFSYFWKYSFLGFLLITGTTTFVYTLNKNNFPDNPSQYKASANIIRLKKEKSKTTEIIPLTEIKLLLNKKQKVHNKAQEKFEEMRGDYDQALSDVATHSWNIEEIKKNQIFLNGQLKNFTQLSKKYENKYSHTKEEIKNNENKIKQILNNNYPNALLLKNLQKNLSTKEAEFVFIQKEITKLISKYKKNNPVQDDQVSVKKEKVSVDKNLNQELTKAFKTYFEEKIKEKDKILTDQNKTTITFPDINQNSKYDLSKLKVNYFEIHKTTRKEIQDLKTKIFSEKKLKKDKINKLNSLLLEKVKLYLLKNMFIVSKNVFSKKTVLVKEDLEGAEDNFRSYKSSEKDSIKRSNKIKQPMDQLEFELEKINDDIHTIASHVQEPENK